MPLTDESVLFREKDGGHGGDPTWTAEAIVRLDQDTSAKGVKVVILNRLCIQGENVEEGLKARRVGELAR